MQTPRATKIVATLGPASSDPVMLERLIGAGVNVVRVNFSHGTAHRAEATTHGIAAVAPIACAGPLMAAELDALGRALLQPRRPLMAIVAGSKVSTKLSILKTLAERVDQLIVGGGIANTFLLAAGLPIGKSLAEADLVAVLPDWEIASGARAEVATARALDIPVTTVAGLTAGGVTL